MKKKVIEDSIKFEYFLKKSNEMFGFGRAKNEYESRWGFDWSLSDENEETVKMVVEGWTGSDKGTGQKFIDEAKRNSAASSFPHFYKNVRKFFKDACSAAEKGDFTCSRCFDLGNVVVFGTGCCGAVYCTDIVNAEVQPCPLCAANEDSEGNGDSDGNGDSEGNE